jgi:hypothetical protein
MVKSICSLSQDDVKVLEAKMKLKNKTKKRYVIKKNETKEFIENLSDKFSSKRTIIPLRIFQIWDNKKTMPNSVKKSVEMLKQQNPEFEHTLLDLDECREFIKGNFPKSVLTAYDGVKPYALKADLARYCLLYKYGGIYLDCKYYCINDFKMIYLTDKEYFCRDVDISFDGIYNAILICKPKNSVLRKSIDTFVKNTQNRYYGSIPLCVGPLMMKEFFTQKQLDNLELTHEYINNTNRYIQLYKHRVLKVNEDYYREKRLKSHYWADLWKNNELYVKN